jgi:alkanesulfonate monooxygenase SsuD/methylene tetrahydromethanopterin reductase-like flavin-dependent oxidoreductase (luciferase family)
LPVAVTDDEAEGRAVAGQVFAGYGVLPNYRRILDIGACDSPGDAAIVGDEASVTQQIHALADAGVTDFWAAPFPIGADKKASRQRTTDLLKTLVA